MCLAPARAVKGMGVFSILLAFFALANLSFAQNRSKPKRQLSDHSLLTAQPQASAISVQPAAKNAVPPPNTSDSWTGLGDGTSWNNAANWSSGVPNSSTVDVTIGTTTANVNLNQAAAIGNLTLSHSGDALNIQNGQVLTVNGSSISNAGTLTLSGTNFGTDLIIEGNTTLSGGGSVTLTNSTANVIEGASTSATLTNQETISGGGEIGNGRMTLVNSGTINANQPTALTIQDGSGATATNTGTLEATAGGTLRLQNTTFTNTGGTISANASTLQVNSSTINGGNVTLTGASLLQLNTGTIQGGTLTNSATGTIELVSGTNTLGGTINNSAGGTFKIDNGAVLDLAAGTYSQLGTVQVNGVNFGTGVVLQGNVTLSGGTVTLSNSGTNFIEGAAGTDVLTNKETIQGAGHIGNGQMGLINSGTINANQSAGILIQTSSAGFTNSGTLGVSSGDLMHVFGGPFTNFSGSTLTGAPTT